MTTYNNGIYEVVLSPNEALFIARNTIELGANFRAPYYVVESGPNAGERKYGITVRNYADAMQTGRWNWSDADPIRLHHASDGSVVCSDGMHRLAACAKSGVPLRSVVMVGEQFVAGSETDRGKSRTFAQLLNFRGETRHVALMSGAVRLNVMTAMANKWGVSNPMTRTNIHADDLIEVFEKHQDRYREYSTIAGWCGRELRMSSTAVLAFLVAVEDDAEDIILILKDLDDRPIGCPWVAAASVARNYERRVGRPLTKDTMLSVLVKAWEHWLAGSTVTKLTAVGSPNPRLPGDLSRFIPTAHQQQQPRESESA